jgi:hypothetical protein
MSGTSIMHCGEERNRYKILVVEPEGKIGLEDRFVDRRRIKWLNEYYVGIYVFFEDTKQLI